MIAKYLIAGAAASALIATVAFARAVSVDAEASDTGRT